MQWVAPRSCVWAYLGCSCLAIGGRVQPARGTSGRGGFYTGDVRALVRSDKEAVPAAVRARDVSPLRMGAQATGAELLGVR
jgi:hypothetical protein